MTGRKRILSVTHEIVRDSDRWPAVISCTEYVIFIHIIHLSMYLSISMFSKSHLLSSQDLLTNLTENCGKYSIYRLIWIMLPRYNINAHREIVYPCKLCTIYANLYYLVGFFYDPFSQFSQLLFYSSHKFMANSIFFCLNILIQISCLLLY